MLTCPMCQKEIAEPAAKCPRCQADLSLLSDFVTDLRTLLENAEAHRRAGDITAAVQAYLAVLDVDPTNLTARTALGPALLAVRAAGRVERVAGTSPRWFMVIVVAALAAAAGFSAGTFLRL